MSPVELAFLTFTAFISSTLTALIGFGGGTILMAVLLNFMTPAVAIPFHGVVQLASNGWRVLLFRAHIGWHLGRRFVVLLPVGVALGLWLFQGLSKEAIQVMIGCLVLGTLFTRKLKQFRNKDLPLWSFYPLGLVVGTLNMIVGVVAPVVGVLVVRRELSKEGMIATLGFFALLGHIFKVVAFGLVGFRFQDHLLSLAFMIPAVMLGGYAGKFLLGRLNEAVFMAIFKVLLIVLSLKLIVWEGFVKSYF